MEQTETQNSVVTLYDDGSIAIDRGHEIVNVEPEEVQAADILREREVPDGVQG